MVKTPGNTTSRLLHSRVLLLVCLGICFWSMNVASEAPKNSTANVTVQATQYLSVQILDSSGNALGNDGIRLEDVTWSGTGGMPDGSDETTELGGAGMIKVVTNTLASLTVPNSVSLTLQGTSAPSAPIVKIFAGYSSVPGGTITNPTPVEIDGEAYTSYTVQAPTAQTGIKRESALTVKMYRSAWTLQNPSGTYKGTLKVTVAPKN